MIALTRELLIPLLAEARLAPSVYNIQPSRWRMEHGHLLLLGDPACAVPVADPDGRNCRLSHGAHLAGLEIALGQYGLQLHNVTAYAADTPALPSGLVPIANASVVSARGRQTPSEPVDTRMSWRGKFRPVDQETTDALDLLDTERDDCLLIRDRATLLALASLADLAGMHFLRDQAYRRERAEWMRLSRSHDSYEFDGLNAEAMNMSGLRARVAGLALGPLFSALDRIGLAQTLVSEAPRTGSAAALVLFHRPAGEDALVSGREFYRSWLAMERFGLQGCPISVLADWPASRDALTRRFGVPAGRAIISVFRIGKPAQTPTPFHARLPVEELLV